MDNKKCTCGSEEFISFFGHTWKKRDVEIFECKKCQKSFTEEVNEKTGEKYLERQRSFPK